MKMARPRSFGPHMFAARKTSPHSTSSSSASFLEMNPSTALSGRRRVFPVSSTFISTAPQPLGDASVMTPMDTGGCFIRSTQIRFSTGFSNSLRSHKWIPPSRLVGNRPTFARDLPRSCTMGFRSITLFFLNLLQSCIEDVVQRKRSRTPPAHDSPPVVDLSSLMAPMPPPAHVWSVVRTWSMICFEMPRITTSGSPSVTTGTSIVQPISTLSHVLPFSNLSSLQIRLCRVQDAGQS